MPEASILTTFDSMKYNNCGYYSFGKGLGDAMIKQNKGKFYLSYYLFRNIHYFFNHSASLVYLSKVDRFFKRNDYKIIG